MKIHIEADEVLDMVVERVRLKTGNRNVTADDVSVQYRDHEYFDGFTVDLGEPKETK